MTGHKQTTDGMAYTTGYIYNLSGALIEEIYPSGRKVKNVLDNGGDLSQVQSQKNATGIWRPYVSNFVYTAAGAVSSLKLGNGKFENTQFNSRLQPIQIGLGTSAGTQNLLKLDYEYGVLNLGTGQTIAGTNNGNVSKQTITVPTVGANNGFIATQYYAYDSLNRIQIATENVTPNGQSAQLSWRQQFGYDRYGNRNFDEANTTTLPKECSNNTEVCAAIRPVVNPSVNAANNRLNDYVFDGAGNTTEDAQQRTFIYDAENKQIQVNDANGIVGQYFYDGDGKRVKKLVPNGETVIFVYDAAGKLVAEYANQINQTPKVSYLTSDHLGSPRINTDENGAVIARHDYHPFGEEVIGIGGRTTGLGYAADDVRKQFTGYERDGETQLDYAEARMFASGFGRFTSPDPLLSSGRTASPQTWNRYLYVLNNPMVLVDPNGLYECKGTADECKSLRETLAADKAKLEQIKSDYGGEKSDEYKKAKRGLDAFGCESKGGNCIDAAGNTIKGSKDSAKNVLVSFGNPVAATTSMDQAKDGNLIRVSLGATFATNPGILGNEGLNVSEFQKVLGGGVYDEYQSEFDGLLVQSVFSRMSAIANGKPDAAFQIISGSVYDPGLVPIRVVIWDKGWETPDRALLRVNRDKAINEALKTDYRYLLTPPEKKP